MASRGERDEAFETALADVDVARRCGNDLVVVHKEGFCGVCPYRHLAGESLQVKR